MVVELAGTSACQPSMVIAPMVPVWRLRVPGESTTVLSDSVTVDVLVDDAALSVALALEALSVVEADAAFEPSVTLAEPVWTEAEADEALAMMELASEGEIVVVEVELLSLLFALLDAARTS